MGVGDYQGEALVVVVADIGVADELSSRKIRWRLPPPVLSHPGIVDPVEWVGLWIAVVDDF